MSRVVDILNEAIEKFQQESRISFKTTPFTLLDEKVEGVIRTVRIGEGKNKLLAFYGIHGDEIASALAFAKSPEKILELKEGNFQYVGVLTNPIAIRDHYRELLIGENFNYDLNRSFNRVDAVYPLGIMDVLEKIILEEASETKGKFVFIDHHDSKLRSYVHGFLHGNKEDWDQDIYKTVQDSILIANDEMGKVHKREELQEPDGLRIGEKIMDKDTQKTLASGFSKFIAGNPNSLTFEVPVYRTSLGPSILSYLPRPWFSRERRVMAHAKADQYIACQLKRL